MKNKTAGHKVKAPTDVSMTPATFERSQSRIKKKATRRRRSYDGDATTQIFANESQLSQGMPIEILICFSISHVFDINNRSSKLITCQYDINLSDLLYLCRLQHPG